MTCKVFYSFAYTDDHWRVSQVRNIGAISGNQPVKDNDWEKVKRGGNAAIQRWIDGQMKGRGCTVVLIGESTAGRKWINYEIEKSWKDRKGLLGIRIHNLKNAASETSNKGANPFDGITVCRGNVDLGDIVPVWDPGWFWGDAYGKMKDNLANWVDDAINTRRAFRCDE